MSVTRSHCRSHRGLRKRLEPYAGKLARTVLRGGVVSNDRSLPDAMTTGEVLAFKNFQCWKDEPPTLRTCFHSAFDEPDPPEQPSERQSCEYRIGVYFLND